MAGKNTLSSTPVKIEPGTRPEDYFGWGKYTFDYEKGIISFTIDPLSLDSGFNVQNWAHYAIRTAKNKSLDYKLPKNLADHLQNIQEGLEYLKAKKLLINFQLVITFDPKTGIPSVLPRNLRIDKITKEDIERYNGANKNLKIGLDEVKYQSGMCTRGAFSTDGGILWNPDTARFTILYRQPELPKQTMKQR